MKETYKQTDDYSEDVLKNCNSFLIEDLITNLKAIKFKDILDFSE